MSEMAPHNRSWLRRALTWLSNSSPIQRLEQWVNDRWSSSAQVFDDVRSNDRSSYDLPKPNSDSDEEAIEFLSSLEKEEQVPTLTTDSAHHRAETVAQDLHFEEDSLGHPESYADRLLRTDEPETPSDLSSRLTARELEGLTADTVPIQSSKSNGGTSS